MRVGVSPCADVILNPLTFCSIKGGEESVDVLDILFNQRSGYSPLSGSAEWCAVKFGLYCARARRRTSDVAT